MGSRKVISDDLTLIKGIGPDARDWLADTYDVCTFAALADLSVDDLIDQIKAENKPWLRWARDWPAEAARRVAEMKVEAEAQQPVLAPVGESSVPKFNSPAGGKDGWDTLALYFVEFQSRQMPEKPVEKRTKVVFADPDPKAQQVDEIYPGIERELVWRWISEHFDSIAKTVAETESLPDAGTMPEENGPSAIQENGPSAISISQVRLFQPAGADSPLFSCSDARSQRSLVAADQAFDIEAILEESEATALENVWSGIDVQFIVKVWDSKDTVTLGTVELAAIEDQRVYSALLRSVSLPRGNYRLQVLTLSRPKPVYLGSIEISMLSVW